MLPAFFHTLVVLTFLPPPNSAGLLRWFDFSTPNFPKVRIDETLCDKIFSILEKSTDWQSIRNLKLVELCRDLKECKKPVNYPVPCKWNALPHFGNVAWTAAKAGILENFVCWTGKQIRNFREQRAFYHRVCVERVVYLRYG